MSELEFDVLVIGAGPGGYVAAIRAAQLGLNTACVDARETLGGTCLNVGCIPSKALLHASQSYEQASSGALEKLGIDVSGVKLNLKSMLADKDKTVEGLTKGIEFLFKKNGVTRLTGLAAFTGPNTVKIGDQTVRAKDIIIATGSSVRALPGIEIDQKSVVDSTGALDLQKVPDHMVVIGGGVIGLELGSVWRRLGAQVTIIEFEDQILPGFDGEVRKNAARVFKKQGFKMLTGHKVTGAKKTAGKVELSVEKRSTNKTETIEADVVLVAIGRHPNTDGLKLEKAGLSANSAGQVEVDGEGRTKVAGIWAIGDVTPGLRRRYFSR